MNHCRNCGYDGRPQPGSSGLAVIAALAWVVPLTFLSQGYWPFFLLPAVALTAWAWFAARTHCPRCGTVWRSDQNG